ncbi:hypothetical protein [Heyndrickxia oleronia]|uniref:NADH dehydrogenase subunit 6 n=1 Tax=Heyndrickxia oleronia TaxID=38875 RepID=A0AAW6SZU3_9BACI|nr:hypothetical protein [Heyndrickxia oleronia]MDH5162582.1 hypothetical protein [Heyndrickxia oleronia]
MKYFIQFLIAILLTALSYFIASILHNYDLSIWKALIIGTTVVLVGAITEKMKSPMWLIIFIPFPIGMLLLFVFLNVPALDWLFTYLTTLVIYTIIHIIMSFFFKFHSLIPAWKLS